MLNQMKEKVECERCQCLVSRTNRVPHQKTKKCVNAWEKYLTLCSIRDRVTNIKEAKE
jgi:hypothetical protein